MKRYLFIALLTLSAITSYAYDACIDGIYYDLIPKAKQAKVTNGDVYYSGDIVIPEKITSDGIEYSVTSISSDAFSNCGALTSIVIPNSVTSIPNSAFKDCFSLLSIDLPNSLTSIDFDAFNGCRTLGAIDIPNSVTSIGTRAFKDCISLTSIAIPNSVTKIADYTFNGCKNLRSVDIPNSVTAIYAAAFNGCNSLTSITIPNSVRFIDSYVFLDCSSLVSVDIPNSVESIGSYSFYGCSSLTSVTIPNLVKRISSNTFQNCNSLTSIIIPNSVTSIDSYAFHNCAKLVDITIGNSVRKIESRAFYNCSNLENVYCEAVNVPYIDSNAFEDSYIEYANLYVPAESYNAYKVAEVWKEFGTITRMSTIPVDSISIERDSIELYVGDMDRLAVEIFPDYANNKTISWSSSDEEVVSVDETGAVTAKAGGSAYIYASSTDGSNVVDSCYVLVRVDVDSIKIFADTTLLCVGNTDSLSVVVLPENATYKDVVWSSAKPKIVSIDSIGVITALDYGTAYIYATATDGSEVVDSCLITVKAELFELNDGIDYMSEETFPCDTLTNTRNFSNTNWNALYVPFAMQYDDWSADFEVARLNDVHQFDDDEDGVVDRTVLELIKLKEGSSTEPNTPYMIKAKEEGEKTITLADATLYATEENSFDVTSWFTRFTFTGTYSTVTDMATKGHYALADGSLMQASSDAATLGAFRWYLDITDRNGNPAPSKAKRIFLSFDDGETTEINVVEANVNDTNANTIYSVSGVNVGKNKGALPKGLYISNGKKFLIK